MELTREQMLDLLVTALEGGSNYWYYIPNLDDVINVTPYMSRHAICDRIIEAIFDHNITLFVYDIEDENNFLGNLDLDSLIRGTILLKEQYPHYFAEVIDEDFDATTADVWLQLCVMNEVVYG